MSNSYYESGANHYDHHKEIHIDTVNGGDIGKLISAFFNAEAKEAEIVEDVTNEVDTDTPDEQLNYFAPTKNLQTLLKQNWFRELRTNDDYDAAWTDVFVEALMASEWKDGIANDWAIKGERKKTTQIKGFVVGLLKDNGVLKGSYDGIASKVGLTEQSRTFSRYMSQGKNQPYADWVKEYVANH